MSVQGSGIFDNVAFPPYVQFGSRKHWTQPSVVVPMMVPLYGARMVGCHNPLGVDISNRKRLSDNWDHSENYHKNLDISRSVLPYPSMVKCSTLKISENSAFEPYMKTTYAQPQSSKCSVVPTWEKCAHSHDIMKNTAQNEIKHKRNITCTLCNKCFARPGTLKVHMRIHRGERPYRCPYCCKSFSQSGNRTVHIRVHTGEKSYSCKECGKCFRQRSTLRSHLYIHNKK